MVSHSRGCWYPKVYEPEWDSLWSDREHFGFGCLQFYRTRYAKLEENGMMDSFEVFVFLQLICRTERASTVFSWSVGHARLPVGEQVSAWYQQRCLSESQVQAKLYFGTCCLVDWFLSHRLAPQTCSVSIRTGHDCGAEGVVLVWILQRRRPLHAVALQSDVPLLTRYDWIEDFGFSRYEVRQSEFFLLFYFFFFGLIK